MHSHSLVHCDIKPDNILIKSQNELNVVITDFELVQPKDKKIENYAFGTIFYKSPELLEKKAPTFQPAFDMWGLGVVVAELVRI